ncbi:MAG: hypothetical protein FGM27_08040 [Candidatus Omnitrophica bacterium]|nr:hypothetical protein [Candidatus Omnitrophota bacterium]
MSSKQRPFFFHLIGISSLLGLAMTLFYLAAGALRGDFKVVQRYFETYPGMELFLIVLFPVMITGAWAWLKALRDHKPAAHPGDPDEEKN